MIFFTENRNLLIFLRGGGGVGMKGIVWREGSVA